MKILAAYYTHKPGGFCLRLYRCLQALASREHAVFYFTLDTPPDPLPGVTVCLIPFPIRTRSGMLFWVLFLTWAPIWIAIRALKLRPNRYVAFGAFYSTLLLLARVVARAPLILFLRSLVFRIDEINQKPKTLRIFSNFIDRLGIFFATRIVCMTQAMGDEIQRFTWGFCKNFIILPNDLPNVGSPSALRDAIPEMERLPILLTSGVLDARKNIFPLLNAFAQLPFECALVVAGDGPQKEDLQAFCRELSLSRVYFPGWVAGLGSKLSDVALTIHPSLHEGVSNSVLESLAHGVPVLAADTPEMREVLVHDQLLFSPTSAPKIMITIGEALTDLEHIRKLCQHRAATYRFDWDTRIASIIENV